jgi:hypothetical protein
MFGLSPVWVKNFPTNFLGYNENDNKNTALSCADETDTIPHCPVWHNNCHNKQMDMDTREVAQRWLDDLAYSAATGNLEAHMALVSREVKVRGVPGHDTIDYRGWKERRRNEFSNRLLRSLTYRLHDIIAQEEGSLLFTVVETMRSHQGQTITVDKAIKIRREEDGIWRVILEWIDRIEHH